MALPSELFDAAGNIVASRRNFQIILDNAKAGDATAQSMAGYCYLRGLGTKRDSVSASEWLLKAAKRGHVDSMVNLALMFEVGDRLPTNRRKAMRWYRLAAEVGSTFAQVNLGLMLLGGSRTKERRIEGVEWLKKAARKRDPRALYNLGVACLRGDGVKKDLKAAERYMKRAANLGDQDARTYLED
ncbi:tetratricopeptide repeat protein [Bryobacter aggregatus]|uniref:tetratricopeptide repeat protein n=1 Tax=Bryobacter aggregatus TaxID=360054 RepID=UPI0004E19471|nr:tetratricopeptide repeat protein [Bryobacter aggregatus]